eukprot:CAMPEP_0201481862 /NCGR_PEP_ID=MMETSP0151_2-20130828/6130_1 /ASSEMBLY_ACC=CAM_ASM_000257 /TAXON_ID=200890 /ORGANISM="Paramoeba atlantica, Strain 621/1 / CCAP 1560/9" /LENGTH=126 /DNA_ID=CAMNT_0047864263 /DNA_START=36 /DNA_END=416 /DNA_ORIENTATION=-
MEEGIKITVTGPNTDKSPKVNGIFLQVDDFLRNGKYCFSKLEGKGQGGALQGAIYFDGTHWKICQAGEGKTETGWNYSQLPANPNPDDLLPPFGLWEKKLATSETPEDYSNFLVEREEVFLKPAKK